MTESSKANVYDMFIANGRRTGFWIQRTTWRTLCCRVVKVGDLNDCPPYYGNPIVLVDFHDLHTGELKNASAHLSCAENYSYRQISPPSWAKT